MAEYDRALFRVYERILEDLNASPPPVMPAVRDVGFVELDDDSTANERMEENDDDDDGDDDDDDINNHRGRRRRRRTSQQRRSGDNSDDATTNITSARRNNNSNNSNGILNGLRRHRSQYEIPFFPPIRVSLRPNDWIRCSRYNNNNRTISGRGRRRGFFQRAGVEETAAPSTPTRYRSLLIHNSSNSDGGGDGGGGNDIASSDDGDVETANYENEEDRASSTASEDSPTGLRRRTSSSPRSSTDSHASTSSSSSSNNGAVVLSPSSSSPWVLQPRQSTDSEEYSSNSSRDGEEARLDPTIARPTVSSSSSSAAGAPPTTAVSLAQRAIRNQLSQRNRRRRTAPTDDHSSSEEDDDDTASSEEVRSSGCTKRNLYNAMRASFALGVLHIVILGVLHVTYVGPTAFRRQSHRRMAEDTVRRRMPPSKKMGWKGNNATTACITQALATRENGERSRYHVLFGDYDAERKLSRDDSSGSRGGRRAFSTGDDGGTFPFSDATSVDGYYYDDDDPRQGRVLKVDNSSSTVETTTSLPLLGKDEILQVKILYGRTSCTGKCSRVHHVDYTKTVAITEKKRLFRHQPSVVNKKINTTEAASPTASGTRLRGSKDRQRQLVNDTALQNTTSDQFENASNENGTAAKQPEDDELSSPEFWQDPHYRFAIDDALLYLDEKSIFLHNITIVNVTVTERCLSTGSDDGRPTFVSAIGEFLSQIYGMDSIMINQFMFGIRSADGSALGGHVQNMETKERWGWRKDQIESFETTSVMEWLPNKIGVLFMSLLSFFLITSVTALIVRVLTSSGVVLMFPLFELLRNGGVPGADERILALTYPWIGAARRAIRTNQTHPQSHLVYAHMTKIVLYYVMYEACQAAWSVVLYSKSIPEALPVWIYGLAMITEYFSMVFVRSATSVHFFPRITLMYFVAYHVYFYSVSYGYFDLALIPLLLFMMHAMLFTVFLEAPSAARGTVSVECPREVYNKLSWPEWSAQLPPEWTIFLPLNMRQTPLHDRQLAHVDDRT